MGKRRPLYILLAALLVVGQVVFLLPSQALAQTDQDGTNLDLFDPLEALCYSITQKSQQSDIRLDLTARNTASQGGSNNTGFAIVKWEVVITAKTQIPSNVNPVLTVSEKKPVGPYRPLDDQRYPLKREGQTWTTGEQIQTPSEDLDITIGTTVSYLAVATIEFAGKESQGCDKETVGLNQPDEVSFSKEVMGDWFDGHVGGLRIQGIDLNNDSAMKQPPFIKLDKGNSNYSGGHTIYFVLISVYGEGISYNGVATHLDRVWFTFEARLNKRDGPRINNLYFLIPDIGYELRTERSGFWNFYYVLDKNQLSHLKKGQWIDGANIGVASVKGQPLETDVNHLAGMVHDFPKSSEDTEIDNCLDASTVEQTGPSEERTGESSYSVNVRESLYGFGKGDKTNLPEQREWGSAGPSALNSNCLNDSSTGWAKYWGIDTFVAESPFAAGECHVGRLFLDGIADAFTKLVRCLIVDLFIPIIGFVAGYIQDAAGVSYYPTQHQVLLVRSIYVLV